MANPLQTLERFFRTAPDAPRRDLPPRKLHRVYEFNRWSVFLSVTFGYGVYYVGRLSFSVIKKPLLDESVLNATEMGLIGSALLICYAIGKLANGFLADRANIRRFMSAGLLVVAAVNGLLGFAPGFFAFLLLWGVNGWVQSIGAPSSIVSLSRWFSPRERGSRYGVWCISHNLGEGLSFVVTAAVASWLGWRWGFFAPAVACAVTALVLTRTLKDRPESIGLPPVTEFRDDPAPTEIAGESVGHMQSLVLRNPAIWVLGLASALMYVSRYAINNWGALVLQEGKGHSLMDAGTILAVYAIAGGAGSFLSGILSDAFFRSRRNLPCLLAGVVQVASLTALWWIPPGHPWLDAVAISVFGFAMGILVSFLGGLMAIDIVSPRAAGAAAGVVGMFSYVGAAIQDALSGWLIDQGRVVHDTTVHLNVSGLADFCSALGTDLAAFVGPEALDAPCPVVVRDVSYSFAQPFAFWIGASVLSVLLPLLIWKAGDRALGREK